MNIGLGLGAAFVLLIANGFFVAAEFALLASRRSRIEQLAAGGDRRAKHALAGVRQLSLMLAGAQLGITICSLLLGAVAEPTVAGLIEDAIGGVVDIPDSALHAIGFTIALSIVVFLHMVVGEMAPKSWAISHPEKSALALARPFRWFVLLFRPVISLLNFTANGVVRAVGVEPQDELAMAHSAADLLLLLEESAGHGEIGADEHKMLARSLELSGLTAGSAMTPRRQVVAIDAEQSAEALADLVRTSGRSRIVTYEGDLDHGLGVVHAKDVLLLDHARRSTTLARDLSRPVAVTHEGHLLEDLLLEMRTGRQHLAVVVDERGVVAGIVTMEDVLEELIGDFDDETDRPQRSRRAPRGAGRIVPGITRPADLSHEFGIDLPDGDWTTLAGYLIAELDRVPQVGESLAIPGATFTVAAVDGYAITEVRIELVPIDVAPDE
jgi:CBS domain containing-hemolysin-like protein